MFMLEMILDMVAACRWNDMSNDDGDEMLVELMLRLPLFRTCA